MKISNMTREVHIDVNISLVFLVTLHDSKVVIRRNVNDWCENQVLYYSNMKEVKYIKTI